MDGWLSAWWKLSCDLLFEDVSHYVPFGHFLVTGHSSTLYSLLFTMHEIEPSVRVWSNALSEQDMILLFFYSRLKWLYYVSSWPLSLSQNVIFSKKLDHNTMIRCLSTF